MSVSFEAKRRGVFGLSSMTRCSLSQYRGLLNLASEVADNAVDVVTERGENADDCKRYQSGCHCIFRKFQACLIAKKVLNHLFAP
jgi:hypothetical protein